jgi:putative methionine-R-sulfoxide reductase with GAF domain
LRNKVDNYKRKIQILIDENKKLKEINQMLLISISRKEEFILKIINENKELNDNYTKTKSKYDLLYNNLKKNIVPLATQENQRKSSVVNNPLQIDMNEEKFKKSLGNDKKGFKTIIMNKTSSQTPMSIKLNSIMSKSINEKKDKMSYPKIMSTSIPESIKTSKFAENKDLEDILDSGEENKVFSKGSIMKDIKKQKNTITKESNSEIDHEHNEIENKEQIPKTSNFNCRPSVFYQKISDIAVRNRNKKKFGQTQSFLALKEDFLAKLLKSDIVRELYAMTNNEEDFISSMRNVSEDKLISYCDMVNSLVKDYMSCLKLINRVRDFLLISMTVNSSMFLEEATVMVIKNTCSILNCDRASIFVHEKTSNLLFVHTGEGLTKSQLKIPCDVGIVGHCFIKGERLKIDDAYLDERFNKDVDIKTNYRTKSLLCVPLKTMDGQIFGVLEAINKKDGTFDLDDEELMEYFANQASSILNNSINYDENTCFISRLKMLCEFSIGLHNKNLSIEDLTLLIEQLFMKFWSLNIAVFYFTDQGDKLFRKTKYDFKEMNTQYGLIGYCFRKKEFIGINKADDSSFYNSIVDIETGFSIITFPIINGKEKVLGILQTAYPHKLNPKKRLNENDMCLINMFCDIVSLWLDNQSRGIK